MNENEVRILSKQEIWTLLIWFYRMKEGYKNENN